MVEWDVEIPVLTLGVFDGCKVQRIGDTAYVRVIADSYREAKRCIERYLKRHACQETQTVKEEE
jgi:hypothetical protein